MDNKKQHSGSTNYLKDLFPEIYSSINVEWTLRDLPNLKIETVTCGSSQFVYFDCKEHPWQPYKSMVGAKIRAYRKGNKGCNICGGRVLIEGFRTKRAGKILRQKQKTRQYLKIMFPEIYRTIDIPRTQDNNPDLDIESLTIGMTGPKISFKCPEHPHQPFEMSVNRRITAHKRSISKATGCTYCSGKLALKGFNTVEDKANWLLDSWSPANSKLPSEVVWQSNKPILWLCNSCGYEWSTSPNSRVSQHSGCERCSAKSRVSRVETRIGDLIDASPSMSVSLRSHRGWFKSDKNKSIEIDMVVTHSSGKKVFLEYDGSFYHKDSVERDTYKTHKMLSIPFYGAVRIRENNLFFLELEDPRLLQINYTYHHGDLGIQKIIDQLENFFLSNAIPEPPVYL